MNPAIHFGRLPNLGTGRPVGGSIGEVGSASGNHPTPLLPEWVARMNERYAQVRMGADVYVADFQTPATMGKGAVGRVSFIKSSALRAELAGQFAPPAKGGEKPRHLAEAWLNHIDRRQYEGVGFDPDGTTLSSKLLNLWQGFAVATAPGDVEPWLHVLAALVPDAGERAYVLRWLAWKIQHPGGVPDTVLIFTGTKGAGKNALFEPLVHIFGHHAMLADDPELIVGRFTWHLMHLSLAVLDEAIFTGDPRQGDRLKARVTAKTMQYEQKGQTPISGANRCAYVMLTNHSHVWPATIDERRPVILEVGDGLCGDLEFWKRYHEWSGGTGSSALLHYLQQIDLTGFNPRDIPRGEALRRQVELTSLRDPAAEWWHSCLSDGYVCWTESGVTLRCELKEDSETQASRAGLRHSYEQSAGAKRRVTAGWPAAYRRVRAWTGDGFRTIQLSNAGRRDRADVLPPLKDLRARFTEQTGVQF